MLSMGRCFEKCSEYSPQFHPKIWRRLITRDALRIKIYNVLAEYLQESAPELNDDDDCHLLGAFGIDDTALEEVLDWIRAAGS
jgi:hypothetical protein